MPQTPPPQPDEYLTAAQLAEAVGPRRAGRPTDAKTVRSWMSRGLRGVVLRGEADTYRRWTTWGWYREWVAKVLLAREADLERKRSAVKRTGRARARQLAAKRELEAAGAR